MKLIQIGCVYVIERKYIKFHWPTNYLICATRTNLENLIIFGPKHTPNPSTLRKFGMQKSTHKISLRFSEKFHWKFKLILYFSPKNFRRHYPLKIHQDFYLEGLKFFWSQKYGFFGHFPISSNFILSKIVCWPSVDWNITDRSETYF